MSDFNPDAGGEITLQEATDYTKNYREKYPDSVRAHYFGKECFQAVLDQEGEPVGIRIYYALDKDSKPQLILCGVDEDGNDMYNGVLEDMSSPCPSQCDGADSPLNK